MMLLLIINDELVEEAQKYYKTLLKFTLDRVILQFSQ